MDKDRKKIPGCREELNDSISGKFKIMLGDKIMRAFYLGFCGGDDHFITPDADTTEESTIYVISRGPTEYCKNHIRFSGEYSAFRVNYRGEA